MAGLLDPQIDPLSLGLLNAGSALMMPGRRGRAMAPMAFAQGLLQGQESQRKMAQDDRRERWAQEEMGIRREAADMDRRKFDAHMSDAEAARAAAAEKRRFVDEFIATASAKDPEIAALARVDLGAAIARAYPKPEWKTWFDAQGRQTQGFVAPGRSPEQIGGAERKVQMVNTGNAFVPVDPLAQTAPIPVGMSPAERDAAARGWASNSIAKQRLEMDRTAAEGGRWSNDLERGLQINTATGETRPMTAGGSPIGPKEKPPTESQSNSYLFANRASAAHKIINDLGDKPSIAGVAIKQDLEGVPLIGKNMARGANLFLGAESQKYEQAKRDFVNAVLRKESGAVIAQSEFDNADRQYFPQPGDGEAVVKQKAEARQRAIDGLSVGAGPLGARIGEPGDNAAAPGGNDLQAAARAELERRAKGRGGSSGSF